MMKRALTATIVGGLMTFFAPHAAFADHSAEHRGDCGAKTEKAAEPDQQAPRQQPYGDREQEHSDGGEVLF
jgi:hypothetical protein